MLVDNVLKKFNLRHRKMFSKFLVKELIIYPKMSMRYKKHLSAVLLVRDTILRRSKSVYDKNEKNISDVPILSILVLKHVMAM